jgi:hypothetical protein
MALLMHPFYGVQDNGESKMSESENRKNIEKDKTEHDKESSIENSTDGDAETADTNPPRTTTSGWLTTPKFGSATSGGGEIDPGPERD